MYFGVESHNIWSDVIMSFMISLTATTPGFIIRKMFEYSKPKVEQHRHHEELVTPDGDPEFEGVRSMSSSNIQDQVTLKMVKRMRHEFYEWMFPLVCGCLDRITITILLQEVCVFIHSLSHHIVGMLPGSYWSFGESERVLQRFVIPPMTVIECITIFDPILLTDRIWSRFRCSGGRGRESQQ